MRGTLAYDDQRNPMAISRSSTPRNFRFWILDLKSEIGNPKSKIQHAGLVHLRRRGQGALEYAALLTIILAALLGMAVYTKRSLCGRWRSVGDVFGSGRQYEPGVTRITVSQ